MHRPAQVHILIYVKANGRVQDVDITPTRLGFQVDPRLAARIDAGIKCHIISKEFVRYIGSPVMEPANERRVVDSRGRSYDTVGIIKATWRVQGYHNSQLDYFTVVQGDFPDGINVLLANSDRVQNSLSLSSNSSTSLMLPLFFSKETKS